MNGLGELLNKLSAEDIAKLQLLFSAGINNQAREVVTLRVFCEEYKDLIRNNRSKNYYSSVECAFKHLLNYFSPQKPIGQITLKETELFVMHLQQQVRKGYRVYYRTLKAAFNKALDWNYISENYFVKVKLPKKQKLNPAYIDDRQLMLICKKISVEVVKEISILGFYTGMRLSELVNLTWRNVSLTSRIITVGDESFTTKGRNQRYIPICDEVESVLRKQLLTPPVPMNRDTPLTMCKLTKGGCKTHTLVLPLKKGEDMKYVFCKSNGMQFTGDYVSKKFKYACRAAGVDSAIHFHSLRHSFASNLAQKGVSLYTIKELLGHSSISTTEIYSHLNVDALKDAIEKLNSPHPSLLPKGEGVKQSQLILINTGE